MASLASNEACRPEQLIEGYNIADLAWGTADAKSIALSFWVRSSLTGTFGGGISNNDRDRSYPFTYSISAANTWEYKTIVVPGDTTGTWLTDSGIGMRVRFGLGVGSTLSGAAGAWEAADYQSATGAVSVIGTLNATFYITGAQLEAGSVATPFERRSYGQELALCQRYYERTVANTGLIWTGDATNNNNYYLTGLFFVPKRATPTFTGTGSGGTGFSAGAPSDAGANAGEWNMGFTCNSTGARRYFTAGFAASAEL